MYLTPGIITTVILLTLSADFLLKSAADFLNLKNSEKSVPDEFKDHIDEKTYEKSQKYLEDSTKVEILSSLCGFCAFLLFWFTKGFWLLDSAVRSLQLNTVFSGLLYIGILLFLKFLLSLPFTIYSTFIIEEKYGFNKTPVALFISDTVKSLLITAVLGGLILSLILLFFVHAGKAAWLICWGASALFVVTVQYVFPSLILPLFNKFTPLEEGNLRKAVMKYASSINFPLNNIFVMDGSRRSTKANAFFTGLGKNRRIVLFDTLVRKHSVNELVAIIAHEMGHFKKKHISKKILISILHMGVVFFLLSLFITSSSLSDAFFMDQTSVYAGLVFFGILYAPVELILSFCLRIYTRKDELEADRFAVHTGIEREDLITALKKLSVDNLSNLTPHPFYVGLHYSHPPIRQRIEALRNI